MLTSIILGHFNRFLAIVSVIASSVVKVVISLPWNLALQRPYRFLVEYKYPRYIYYFFNFNLLCHTFPCLVLQNSLSVEYDFSKSKKKKKKKKDLDELVAEEDKEKEQMDKEHGR